MLGTLGSESCVGAVRMFYYAAGEQLGTRSRYRALGRTLTEVRFSRKLTPFGAWTWLVLTNLGCLYVSEMHKCTHDRGKQGASGNTKWISCSCISTPALGLGNGVKVRVHLSYVLLQIPDTSDWSHKKLLTCPTIAATLEVKSSNLTVATTSRP